MSKYRQFHGEPFSSLIVKVSNEVIEAVDQLTNGPALGGSRHPARGNRSEFVRLAIEEKLARDQRARTGSPGQGA